MTGPLFLDFFGHDNTRGQCDCAPLIQHLCATREVNVASCSVKLSFLVERKETHACWRCVFWRRGLCLRIEPLVMTARVGSMIILFNLSLVRAERRMLPRGKC